MLVAACSTKVEKSPQTSPSSLQTSPSDSLLTHPQNLVGGSITGDTPCPPETGADQKISSFENPPPLCIDPTVQYIAIINTSKGPITVYLNHRWPSGINNFVVLARYHFYDGMPFTGIEARNLAQVLPYSGESTLGYVLPSESVPGGQILPVGAVVTLPENFKGNTGDGASFAIVLGEKAADLPEETTTLGLILDGMNTIREIERSTDISAPTTIESIVITQEPRT